MRPACSTPPLLMNPAEIATLTRSLTDGGHEFTYLRPGIVAAYYLTADLRSAGIQIAEVIRQYIRFVGTGALTYFLAENGTFKPLDDRRLQRDLGLLGALPARPDLSWEYSSAGDGGVGDWRIRIFAADPDEDFPELTSLVRLEFPADAVDRLQLERLVQFIAAAAGALRPQWANAGWGFKRAEPFATEARKAVNQLLPRYLGFDPGFDLAALSMRDHALGAYWLNFLDESLFAKCGGEDTLRDTAPGVQVQRSGSTVMIRASRVPPIGDSNRNAPDLGCMPGVARFLRPVRVALEGLGDDRFDVRSWLARLDDRPSLPWDN